ncbi:MAG: cytochrome P450 [Solirubrobacteraceae bacterium]|jgi:cytochrome P450
MQYLTRQQPSTPPLPSALQTLAFWRHPHAYLEWCRRRYGARFTVNAIGIPPMVFMSDPAAIKAIVGAPANVLHPGAGGRAIVPLVGDGSFMLAEEDEHLAGRRAILPAFHRRVINEHAEMVRDIAARELAKWPRGTSFASHPYLRALTLRVILRTIFGGEEARLRELHARLLTMFAVTRSLTLQEPPLRRVPGWRGIWRSFLVDRAAVDKIIAQLIEEEAHSGARDSGLLSMLLGGQHPDSDQLSITQIRDTLMSVILAGHETTASELAWAFQLLAHEPLIAGRLVDDLDAGGEAYLTAAIQEVLRHRPVFLFTIPRVVRRPFEIAGTTYRPPVQLVGCIHLMQHDPGLYPEPHRFRPERFLDAPPRPEVWMPWGGGRKRCPGHHLAMLEMRTVLETVLRDFELLPVGEKIETARWRSVIVTPGRGSRIMLRKRQRGFSGRTTAAAARGVLS